MLVDAYWVAFQLLLPQTGQSFHPGSIFSPHSPQNMFFGPGFWRFPSSCQTRSAPTNTAAPKAIGPVGPLAKRRPPMTAIQITHHCALFGCHIRLLVVQFGTLQDRQAAGFVLAIIRNDADYFPTFRAFGVEARFGIL